MIYKDLLAQATEEFQENKKLVQKFKKSNHRDLDNAFHKEHDKVFKKIDCLACANCCKTTSPIFRDVDIKRIASKLRIPIGKFIETYLKIDEERDYVLKQSPCAFLSDDNTCDIYEDRPLACREYPHTNRKNMYQILDLTLTNSQICPAVSSIFTTLKVKK
jgi:Fe-S-cluster containining protein